MGGRPDGNRQDNRQRGNAAQLLEKYKNMARDSQLAGDRVQTEYYLQFADHYFRVLSESRARFEDQRPRRDDDLDDDDGEEMEADAETSSDDEQGEEAPRAERFENRQRSRRFTREERGGDDRNADYRNGEERSERAEPRRGNGRLRVNGEGSEGGIALDVLPPAIGPVEAVAAEDDREAAAPRRRTRRPRAAGNEDEIAPAA